MVNSLANHGYIPRDGRDVRMSDVKAALKEVGLSTPLTAAFVHPVFQETKASQSPRSFLQKVVYFLRNPWALLGAGMRQPGQKDTMGKIYLNLDQLDLHGVVEHDISISRHDIAQGDNHSPQPQLIRELLDSSSDGKTLSMEDLAAHRKRRIHEQLKINPDAVYGSFQHLEACVEIALILHVFGDGQKVPRDYLRAFFQEERLPMQEGWKKRGWWWPLGIVELSIASSKVKKVIGMKF